MVDKKKCLKMIDEMQVKAQAQEDIQSKYDLLFKLQVFLYELKEATKAKWAKEVIDTVKPWVNEQIEMCEVKLAQQEVEQAGIELEVREEAAPVIWS
jgi:hypothetical protein